jgi:hypothetical protein
MTKLKFPAAEAVPDSVALGEPLLRVTPVGKLPESKVHV